MIGVATQKSKKQSTFTAAFVVLFMTQPTWAADATKVSVELNKLETQEKGCRAYIVVDNQGVTAFQAMKLDLILFQPDGVIGRRFAVDLAPLKPSKRTVKLFDLDGTACDKVGALLINDVVDCKADSGPLADCLAGMTVKSLIGNVQLSK